MKTPTLYSERKRKALDKLLKLADNKKCNLAKELGFSTQTIQMWFTRGQISKNAAVLVSNHEFFSKHISKEELRPDVIWD